MSAYEPEFIFPGLEGYQSVDFVYNRGVMPSVALVKVPYISRLDFPISTMAFTF